MYLGSRQVDHKRGGGEMVWGGSDNVIWQARCTQHGNFVRWCDFELSNVNNLYMLVQELQLHIYVVRNDFAIRHIL